MTGARIATARVSRRKFILIVLLTELRSINVSPPPRLSDAAAGYEDVAACQCQQVVQYSRLVVMDDISLLPSQSRLIILALTWVFAVNSIPVQNKRSRINMMIEKKP